MNAAIHRISKAKQALESGLLGDQPKYRCIFESLRESILSGEFQEGRRLPSETELVRRFGVSRMTIVKAVKELQQLGLVTRRVGSGTYAAHRQALEHQLFGLLIPELGQTEIFEPVCQGMAAFPAATQHSLLWSSGVGESRDKESAALELCERYVGQHVSGVFFAPLELTPARDEINRRIIERLASAGIPVVLLDRCYAPYPRRSPYDLVGIDNRRTAYLATEHLFCAGARRVAFLGRPHSASTVEARIAGWREALFARGQGMDGGLVLRADPDDTDIVRRFLDRHHPDAFLCANDNTATALMQTLLAMGRRVPEEIRMMGIDDVKYAALLPVPLTTQHQPCVEIGAMAMATMLDRVAHPELPVRDVLLDCRLVVRRSCGASKNRTMEGNA